MFYLVCSSTRRFAMHGKEPTHVGLAHTNMRNSLGTLTGRKGPGRGGANLTELALLSALSMRQGCFVTSTHLATP